MAALLLYDSVGTCECCPPDDAVVKVEWDGSEWVYDEDINDGSVVVTGTERLLCFEVVSGQGISEIRVKAGQDVECWLPLGYEKGPGCYGAEGHDLSNALFCKEGATAVELVSFTAAAKADLDLRMLAVCCAGVLLGWLLCLILTARRGQ